MDDLLEYSWNARHKLRTELLRRLFGPSNEAVADAMKCLRLTEYGYEHSSAWHDESARDSTAGAASEFASPAAKAAKGSRRSRSIELQDDLTVRLRQ